MKKTILLSTLTIALLSTGVGLTPSFAAESTKDIVPISATSTNSNTELVAVNQDEYNYISVSGKVTSIVENTKYVTLTITKGEGIANVNISPDTFIIDTKSMQKIAVVDIKKDADIEIYFKDNTFMTMIYPPTYQPDIVVVKNSDTNVSVARFKNLVDVNNTLKLNLSDKTPIVNQKGEKVSSTDLENKNLIVFYTVTTKSLPPQTSPLKVIVIDDVDKSTSDVDKKVNDIISKDSFTKNGVVMIPLRKVAESLGYTVTWENSTAYIKNDTKKITISLGSARYGFTIGTGNDKLIADALFEQAPEIKNGKMYVPKDVINHLK